MKRNVQPSLSLGFAILICALAFAETNFASSKIVKDSITSGGKKRTYHLVVPDSV